MPDPESRAERVVRLLREAADALDEIPDRYRVLPGLLAFLTTPHVLRTQADTIETRVNDARALLAAVDDEPSPLTGTGVAS